MISQSHWLVIFVGTIFRWIADMILACVYIIQMPPPPTPAYDRGTTDHTKHSDNSNSFRCHSDILTIQIVEILIFWEGILTVKTNGKEEILTNKYFLHQNPWVNQGGRFTLYCASNVRETIKTLQLCTYLFIEIFTDKFTNSTIRLINYVEP